MAYVETGDMSVDPRFARRVAEVQRQQRRRRLRWVAVASAVLLVVAGAVGSLFSPWLEVHHIRVTTVGPVSRSEVLSLAGLARPRPMIDVHTGEVTARLDAVADLGGAQIRRVWPNTVDIRVTVRTPVAAVAPTGSPGAGAAPGWATVDATGRVLADLPGSPPGLPVLQGVGAVPQPGGWLTGSAGPGAIPPPPPGAIPPPPPGANAPTEAAVNQSFVDLDAASDSPSVPTGTAAALAVAAALPESVRAAVQRVGPGPQNQLTIWILPATAASGSIPVTLGDGSQLAQKLTALVALLGEANLSGVAGINLTVPDRPAVLTARQTAGTVSTLAVG